MHEIKGTQTLRVLQYIINSNNKADLTLEAVCVLRCKYQVLVGQTVLYQSSGRTVVFFSLATTIFPSSPGLLAAALLPVTCT